VASLADEIGRLRNARVCGLMTMAAFEDDPSRTRPTFTLLRELRGQLSAAPGVIQLSMGMSADFEVAVEEGATVVRLGSVLFEGLDVKN
jgi:uncharacterized pyridoxal phosphate-containing UPF0001 family protein